MHGHNGLDLNFTNKQMVASLLELYNEMAEGFNDLLHSRPWRQDSGDFDPRMQPWEEQRLRNGQASLVDAFATALRHARADIQVLSRIHAAGGAGGSRYGKNRTSSQARSADSPRPSRSSRNSGTQAPESHSQKTRHARFPAVAGLASPGNPNPNLTSYSERRQRQVEEANARRSGACVIEVGSGSRSSAGCASNRPTQASASWTNSGNSAGGELSDFQASRRLAERLQKEEEENLTASKASEALARELVEKDKQRQARRERQMYGVNYEAGPRYSGSGRYGYGDDEDDEAYGDSQGYGGSNTAGYGGSSRAGYGGYGTYRRHRSAGLSLRMTTSRL